MVAKKLPARTKASRQQTKAKTAAELEQDIHVLTRKFPGPSRTAFMLFQDDKRADAGKSLPKGMDIGTRLAQLW